MKNALYINGNRNGYSPEQCGRTMTVGELIEFLSEYDENRPVYLSNDNGYTYGSIGELDFFEKEEEPEEEEEDDENAEEINWP